MAKVFAPRIAKKKRETLTFQDKLNLFKANDEKLLKGAKLDEINLAEIVVKEQVRTKFNDSSLRELAENIKQNGLIQPLVLHRTGTTYTLICGERRFKAMSLIKMKSAPCFVLENKSPEELLAIQFSENSSREELHYIDKADGILNYQKATNASERKIVSALGISKTEVHRSLLLAKLPHNVKEAAKTHNLEKYVLLEFDALEEGSLKKRLEKEICAGKLKKRSDFRRIITSGGLLGAKPRKSAMLPKGLSANAFLKALKSKSNNLEIDAHTKALLDNLLEETKDIITN